MAHVRAPLTKRDTWYIVLVFFTKAMHKLKWDKDPILNSLCGMGPKRGLMPLVAVKSMLFNVVWVFYLLLELGKESTVTINPL